MKGVYSLIRLGIVYEIHRNRVIVLTPDSEFLVIKRTKDMRLGQQVKFHIQDVKKTMKPVYKFASIASSVAAIFVLVFLYFRVPFYDNVYGFINVDINPSVEFVVDKEFEVLQSKALNEDAKAIVKDLEIKGKDIYRVIDDFVDKCEDYGYIVDEEDNVVLVSASIHDKSMKFFKSIEDDNELENFLININKEINSDKDKAVSGKVIKVSPEDRKAALKNNLSMGKYYLMAKANASGLNMSIEDIDKTKVSDLIAAIDNIGSIITSISQEDIANLSAEDKAEPTNNVLESTPTPTSENQSEPTVEPTSKPSTKPNEEQKVVVDTTTGQTQKTSTPNTNTNKDSSSTNKGKLNIKLLSNDNTDECVFINSDMHIINKSGKDINLNDVKIRYYFTREDKAKLKADVYTYRKESTKGKRTDQVNTNEVKASFHNVSGSDMYMEIAFNSGVLKKDEYVILNVAFFNENYANMNQKNDYSFIENNNTHTLTEKVTAYISDNLVWGKEPY
jgi:hypothetical protein